MYSEISRRDKRVSVCMATYNGAKSIKIQITSVIEQLSTNDELIISDDGSKDDTIAIAQAFGDSRIKIIKNSHHSGPLGNFQTALEAAKGDVIFLCDQDDIWFDNKIKSHLAYHHEYDLVISNAVVIDESKNVLFSSFFKARNSKSGLMNNIIRNSYIGCCMSFTKEIANCALPFPSDVHMHDWWIGLVAEIKGSIFFLKEPLMYYIRHDSNASDTLIKTLPFLEQLKNRLIMVKRLLPIFLHK